MKQRQAGTASAETETFSAPTSTLRPVPAPLIAVLIPCYNEASTIHQVISDFRRALPDANIYVYDNNSSDQTATIATKAGAIVRREPRQGKGNVVRRMFGDIDADVYVMVDGDDTYSAESAPQMVQRLIDEQLDMVNGVRSADLKTAYRTGHKLGNVILTRLVALVFGNHVTDMLSGFRVFSRRFVKSFPAQTRGFEIETELTIHALQVRMPIAEVQTPYRQRPPGSSSKLRTLRDGWRILKTIGLLIKEERPLQFFSWIFAVLATASVLFAWPILLDYLKTGLVPRIPTVILSTGLMLLGFVSLTAGLILDTVVHGRHESRRMWYLSLPAIQSPGRQEKVS